MADDRPGDDRDGLPVPREPDPTPEEQELALKREALRRLSEEAVDLEAKRELLCANLEGSNTGWLQGLGRRMARIDELDLRIAEALLARDPENPVLQRRVQEARARSLRSDEAAREADEAGSPRLVHITEDIKQLYREAARRMHPDLGRIPEERELRHTFMVALNSAYVAGDAEGIMDLLARWEAVKPPHGEQGVAEELVRVIRAIARLRTTVRRIGEEIEVMRRRRDYELMLRVTRAQAEGRDLISERAEAAQVRIREREARLRDLGEQDDAS